MVTKRRIRKWTILTTLSVLLLGSCAVIDVQRLKHKQYFSPDILKKINTEYYYQCVGVYSADKDQNITEEHRNTYIKIKFKKDGYIISDKIGSNKAGYSGVIYVKNNKLKIDLITGTSDGGKMLVTCRVKIEGNRLYLLEQSLFNSKDLLLEVYELTNKKSWD